MIKEEILESATTKIDGGIWVAYPSVLEAMEEYAAYQECENMIIMGSQVQKMYDLTELPKKIIVEIKNHFNENPKSEAEQAWNEGLKECIEIITKHSLCTLENN